MALRSTFQDKAPSSQDISEQLEALEKRMERAKVLYEQYFLGIQKLPPAQIHRDLERRFRELTQLHIRNTALRFRFTTLSQKFGSYNTYWKRVMRQIEQGTYLRDLARVGRQAARRGEDVPDELLAKMPKRMRDRILRDRERLARRAEREKGEVATGAEGAEAPPADPGKVRNPQKRVHQIDASDLLDDVDFDALFSQLTGDEPAAAGPAEPAAPPAVTPPKPPTSAKMPTQRAAVVPPPKPAAPRAATVPPRATTVPPPTPPTARKGAAPKPPPGMSEPEARELYARYKKARELVGERTDNLSYDKLMRSLNKQAPKILADKAASKVHFDVVVKGDKVVLKAKTEK